jgi:hypothetical protein
VRFFALAFVAAAAVIPALQTAADEPAATPAATAAPAATASADADQIVCKTGPAATGTRLGRTRECHTQREWDRMRQDEQSSLVRTQTQITTTTHGN